MTLRDTDPPFIKVAREVPLWSILTALMVVMTQAAALYYGQAKVSDTLVAQAVLIKDLTAQVTQLSNDIAKTNLKTVEYEFKLGDLDRRMGDQDRRLRQVEVNQVDRGRH